MKNKLFAVLLSVLSLSLFTNSAVAQAPFKYLTYIFPSDSLQGFDEEAAKNEALSRGFFGSEYHVIMYSMKRDFINKKYGYYTGGMNSSSNAKGSNPVINAAPCVNEDFESSPSTTSTSTVGTIGTSLLGWTASWGQNSGTNGSCTQSGCCPSAGSTDAWIRQTPWTAPAPLGVIPNSPFGGSKVIQMNDNITAKGEVVRIQQTFPVTPSNALFQFCYKAAMDGSGHLCCDQPYLRIELLDCMNNILACPQVSITPPGPSCATVSATGWTTSGSISYTPNWIIKAIDLSPYLGSCVTIKVTVGDCDGWAHYGYAFFDFQCLPITVTVNNIQFPAGSAVVGVAACGVTTGTMTAPPGLGPYTWNGPAGSGITNNANQTVTTSVPGNYTLTMNPPGICTPITKTVNLQFGSFPNAGVTTANSCTTYTLTNTGTAAPSVQSYSFTGPGAPSSFTTTSPTSVVNFAPSTTYTIYQTVTNPQNCPATASLVITTPPGPSPAFTAAPSWTQCLQGNAYTFNATTAAGTHTWSFNPTAGAPAAGTGSSYGPVNFTAAGTYTVVHTINSAGCVSSTQSVVVVNTAPTASILTAVAPPCAGASATLTGAGGPGTLSWAGPLGWTGVGLNATVPSFNTTKNGTYTLTVNNFGCITTKTVNLSMGTIPTPTISNSGPVCVGQTLTLTATIPPGASYYYWYKPSPYYYGGYNNATGTVAITSTTQAGSFLLYVGYSGCPTQTFATNVQVIAASSLTVTNTGPYCAGSNIQLNVASSSTAATTFSWTGPGSFTANTQNPVRPTATTTMSGAYTVTASIGSCKATGTTNVVVNPIPTVIIGSNSPVCLGQTINLTSTGGGTYAWSGPNGFTSALQNPTLVNSTTAMAGVYTVTVTSAAGCKNTATVNVTVTTPTTTATNAGPFCVGTTIQLNTPAATSYTWTGPNAFTSNLQNPTIPAATAAMGGVYTVTSTTGSCKATATTSVVINPLPVPAPSNTGAYCLGSNIQLNVGAYSTYTWSGPGSFSSNSQNPSISNAALSNAGSYSVTVTDANGCVGTSATNVVVNPLPTPVVNSPTTCENTTIGLTATGGTAFAWSGPGGFTSSTQNPNIPSATTSMTGNYTVTVTDANGCVNTAVASVSVIALPIPTAATGGAVCDGATLNLSSNGGTSYSWSGPNGFTSTSQNPNIPAATLAAGGIYTVVVTANTCTAAATVSATVNPLPTPNIVSNSPVCVGQALTFTGTGGVSYSWTGPNGFTSNSSNPNIGSTSLNNSGNYILTVTDANGCVNTTNSNVTINPLPNASATGGAACENMSINLGASGGATYAWSGPNGFTSNLQNPTLSNVPFAAAGQYTVVVTSAAGCVSTAFTSVNVNPAPVPQIVSNSPICVNNILALSATGGVSYSWTGPNGFSSSGPSTATVNANTTLFSGSYAVTVTDANGCQATTSTNAVINPLPIPQITAANNKGCSPVCASFNLSSNSSIVTANWTMGDGSVASGTSANSCYSTTGIYTITATVTDANGCTNTAQNFSEVYPTPVADFNHAPIKPVINIDQEVTFTDASHGATVTNWNWYFMNTAQYTSTQQNPTFMYTEPGTYAVALVVKSDKGCTDTIVRQLVVGEDYGIYVPNAFSPNGDGLNDMFQPKGFGIVKYEIQIFDRWGEKVFSTKNFDQGWDGKFQGRGGDILEEGSYTWLINVTSVFGKAHELKGHVTLIK